jgi:hypothetical protein
MLARLLKKAYWPLMNADGRGFRTASVLFLICVHQRSSAANLVFAIFRSLLRMPVQ